MHVQNEPSIHDANFNDRETFGIRCVLSKSGMQQTRLVWLIDIAHCIQKHICPSVCVCVTGTVYVTVHHFSEMSLLYIITIIIITIIIIVIIIIIIIINTIKIYFYLLAIGPM